MKQTLTIVAAVFALALTGLSAIITSSAVAETAVAKAKMDQQTLTFVIEKMTCAMCPITVRKAMEKVSGVEEVKVDYKAKTATVIFDPSHARPEAIAAASTNAGYPAQVIEVNVQ